MSHAEIEDVREHVRVYLMVFAALAVLTIVTVAISYLDLPTGYAITLPRTMPAGTAISMTTAVPAGEESDGDEFKGLFGIHGTLSIWVEERSGIPVWIEGSVPVGPFELVVSLELRSR